MKELVLYNESTVVSATLSKGIEQESEYSKEDKLDEEEKDDREGDVDDEDDETDSDKGDKEVTDAVKADAEKTLEVKDDAKKTELPPTSSSLSVSSGFGDQFIKLSSDSSLVSTIKDTTDAEINSLLEVKIHFEPSVLTLVGESPLITTITTLPPPSVSTTPSVPQQITTPIPTPPITTDAPTITTAVSESDALSVVQLRVAKLEKDQIPKVPKKQTPTVDLEQESERSPSEILEIKKEQSEKQNMPKFTINSIDKANLKEYDQKSALYQTMHANKSFNRNPANHQLYHALMEALIEDENAMDKGFPDTVQDHKRKHDDDEYNDDDDKDPPAGLNQCKKTKRRRTKESKSSKKPSTTKEIPKGKPPSKGSKTGKSALAKEPIEEPIAEVVMDDADWFTQPPMPPTLDPEWNKCQVVLDQPEQPWFNQMVSATKDPLAFDDLMATPIDFSKYVLNRLKIDNLTQDILLGPTYNLLKGMCSSSIELEYHFQECFNALTDRLDWNNLEGDRYPFDLSKPLPLTYTTSIMKTKAARYEIEGIEDMVPTLWSPTKVGYDKDALKGIKHWGEGRKLWNRSQLNKFSKQNVYSTKKILRFYKFKEGDFVDLHLNDIEDMLLLVVQHKLFHLTDSDIVDFIMALRMFTRSLVIKKCVEDLQLGVESYQKKLNITLPQQTFLEI
ncbi:hypothetical protein Tco_1297623 [Tanacetum coccineum]